MSSSPSVSVIIPTYKHRDYVLQTLASVFAQSFTDYEIIVINDGSPDDTAEVLRPLVETGRIRYIEQENAGQAAARNRGIAEARGKYIALLDDDDTWPPDKLAWQVQAIEQEPQAVLVYGSAEFVGMDHPFIYPDGTAPTGAVLQTFQERNWVTSPGQTLIRLAALKAIGGFDTVLWGVDDWDLYARLAVCGEFIYVPTIALQYRVHAANASKDTFRMFLNARRMWIKHHGLLPRPAQMRGWWEMRRSINNLYFGECATLAQKLSREGNKRQARVVWRAILSMRPGAIKQKHIVRDVLNCWLCR